MFIPWDDFVKVRQDLFVKVTTWNEDFIAFWERADREPLFPLYWSAENYSKSLTSGELECASLMMTMRRLLIICMTLSLAKGWPSTAGMYLGPLVLVPPRVYILTFSLGLFNFEYFIW